MPSSHGWAHLTADDKRRLVASIASGEPLPGPLHAELNISDRCNVACYFCNQQDLRTAEHLSLGHVVSLIDELRATGLRSVRFAGGGDPLAHPDLLAIVEHLTTRSIVVDNVTTNGVKLTPPLRRALVENGCREIIFSLNAADADDYRRMMQVRGDRFDMVAANIRNLISERGEDGRPSVVVQFLLDRGNVTRMLDMYDLALSLGADRAAFGLVLEVPLGRIAEEQLLRDEHAAAAQEMIARLIERDRERGMLQMAFPLTEWATAVDAAYGGELRPDAIPTAGSFREDEAGCFFAFYTTVIRGNGDLHPCCLMQLPELPTLGSVRSSSFGEQWTGEKYARTRKEMREVLLTRSSAPYSRARYRFLEPYCVEANRCALKNMYFRHDEEFYRELGAALDEARGREVGWLGGRAAALRAFETFVGKRPRLTALFHRVREASRPLRRLVRTVKAAITPSARRSSPSRAGEAAPPSSGS
jgi:MoaA/NifB/PqqE/SkfB family radical SAM enzyme